MQRRQGFSNQKGSEEGRAEVMTQTQEAMADGHRAAEALYRAHFTTCYRCRAVNGKAPAGRMYCRERRDLYALADRAEQRARDAGVEL